MRSTMGGVGGRARKHGVCRAMVPLPVAVSLCITCFFFGLFWGKMPLNNQPVETVSNQVHIAAVKAGLLC